MSHIGPIIFSFVLSLISSAPARIENAFLHNDAEALKPLLASGTFLGLSVSGPAAFSDVLSDEQTILWFRRFFHSVRTVGFYPEPNSGFSLDRGAFVFKARWEVLDAEGKLLAYDVLFLIRNRFAGRSGSGFAESAVRRGIWTLLQIRAEER